MHNQHSSCENVIAVADEPHHHLIIENDWVRAYAVEIGPHGRTLCHRHSLPYLLYVAGDAEIISTPKDEGPQRHHYQDKHCEFAPAGLQHVVENPADAPYRNLMFEVLPEAKGLRRSGLPFANAAGVRVTPLHSGEMLCAELIELNSGAQAQVTGPAVVCSPYEDVVELISPEAGACKLQRFRDLQYVREGSTGLLRCESGQAARVLVVALGCE